MRALLGNQSFLRLFVGRFTTNLGDSLYAIGAIWLVYELTGSTLYTGLAGALVYVPSTIQFLFGPLVDRWDVRRTMVRTQLVQGVVVLAIPATAVLGHLSVWVVLAVIPTLALLNRFVYPAQRVALPRILNDDELVRANSLISTAGKGTNILFNAVSGVLIALIGAVQLFVVDSVTFFIAALLFAGIIVPSPNGEDPTEETESDQESIRSLTDSYVDEIMEGVDYVRGSLFVVIAASMAVSNLGAGMMSAVLPAFADTLAGTEALAGVVGGAGAYGLLKAANGVGNLLGSAGSSVVDDKPYGTLVVVGFTLGGVVLMGAVAVQGLVPTLVLFTLALIPVGVSNVLFGSLMQSAVDDDVMGRVSTMVNSITMLTLPVGNILGGIVGESFGPATAIYVTGALMLFLSLSFILHPAVRSLPSVDAIDADRLRLGVVSEA